VKVSRFRIDAVMIFVALVALDFAAIREMLDDAPTEIGLLGMGALPMANVLAIGLLISHRRRGSSGFLVGFVMFGVAALAAFIAAATMIAEVMILKYLQLVAVRYVRTFVTKLPPTTFRSVIPHSIGVVMFGLPQLAFALIGGYLSRDYRSAERPEL
jgi:hypothetical protein